MEETTSNWYTYSRNTNSFLLITESKRIICTGRKKLSQDNGNLSKKEKPVKHDITEQNVSVVSFGYEQTVLEKKRGAFDPLQLL
jgi:hypothetical protein